MPCRKAEGRFVGQLPQFYGVWSFSKNKTAAKDLLLYISQKPAVGDSWRSVGYDLPSFKSLYDFDTWKTVAPPVGTVYRIPARRRGHLDRRSTGAFRSRRQIYNQAINTVMVSKFTQATRSSMT